jgi:hypothetical protein
VGKFIMLVAVLATLFVGAALFFASMAAEQAIAAYAEIQSQPIGAGELALKSRQTPVIQDDGRRTNGAVALLAILVLTVLATLFVMRGGADFLRQWRLARKRQHQPHHQYMPQAAYLPPAISTPVDQLGRAQRPHRLAEVELPAWTDSDPS